MKKNINFIVTENENNLRVDILINKREILISRTRIKNFILKEKLKLNDEIIKSPSKKVNTGDKIELQIPKPEDVSLKPYNYKLEIVYEDDDILVINKPAGIIMHPGAGNYDKTIVNALMHYDKNSLSTIGDELRPGIVHRIDKNTSGLVVIAKNDSAHNNLSKQFRNHTITRMYQLLIWGKLRPSSGKIDTFIVRSSKNRQLMEVSNSKGKRAITNYKTL
jgi:23S rRNA pseudouridine1911/1915/1917 synthase